MARTATLEIYTGNAWQRVTGRIVKVYETGGVTIDDDNGIRYYAKQERATINSDGNPAHTRSNMLW